MRIETKAKLEYLKGTKSAIADALVEKGQTVSSTDTFRSYADKVRAIKSGGGFEPGIYFKPSVIPPPTNYTHKRFQLNGELYAIWYNSNGAGYANRLSKWDGSKWVSVLTSQLDYMDGTSWMSLEHNGKTHFFSAGEKQNHWVFDGTSFTKSTKTPSTYYKSWPFIYQGKMIMYLSGDGCLYEWNDATSTWVSLGATGITDYAFWFAHNDEVYAVKSKILYQYIGGTLTQIATLSYNGSYWRIYNGKAYCFDNSRNGEAYSIDLTTCAETVYTIPKGNTVCSEIPNDLSLGYYTGSSGDSYMPFFDVTVIEEEG